jgi:hypothetical protein
LNRDGKQVNMSAYLNSNIFMEHSEKFLITHELCLITVFAQRYIVHTTSVNTTCPGHQNIKSNVILDIVSTSGATGRTEVTLEILDSGAAEQAQQGAWSSLES